MEPKAAAPLLCYPLLLTSTPLSLTFPVSSVASSVFKIKFLPTYSHRDCSCMQFGSAPLVPSRSFFLSLSFFSLELGHLESLSLIVRCCWRAFVLPSVCPSAMQQDGETLEKKKRLILWEMQFFWFWQDALSHTCGRAVRSWSCEHESIQQQSPKSQTQDEACCKHTLF